MVLVLGLVLGLVTARSRIFGHRVTAQEPHKTTSPSAPIVHSPAPDRIVATPSAMEMSPAVRVANVHTAPRQLGQHQQRAVAAAEHPAGPAVRGQPAQRRHHRVLVRLRWLLTVVGER